MGTQSGNHIFASSLLSDQHIHSQNEACAEKRGCNSTFKFQCRWSMGMNRTIHPVHLQPAPLEPFCGGGRGLPPFFADGRPNISRKQASCRQDPCSSSAGDGPSGPPLAFSSCQSLPEWMRSPPYNSALRPVLGTEESI